MKISKFSFLGILLALMMMASLLPMAAVTASTPAGAPMNWLTVKAPNQVLGTIIQPGTEVSQIVAGSATAVYAIGLTTSYSGSTASAKPFFWASGNGGETWSPRTPTGTLAMTAITAVAVAPDDAKFVAIAGGTKCLISADGGLNWGDTNLALTGSEAVTCIDVAPSRSGGPMGSQRDIAVGVKNGLGTGRVERFVFAGLTSAWADTSDLANYPGWASGDVYAVAFSPQYATDRTVVAVSATVSGGAGLFLQYANWGAPAWNDEAGFPKAFEIEYLAGNDSPDTSELRSADIALPSDFFGADSAMRRAYVGFDSTEGFSSAVGELQASGDATAAWSTAQSVSGSYSAYLSDGTGPYKEAAVLVPYTGTLGDIADNLATNFKYWIHPVQASQPCAVLYVSTDADDTDAEYILHSTNIATTGFGAWENVGPTNSWSVKDVNATNATYPDCGMWWNAAGTAYDQETAAEVAWNVLAGWDNSTGTAAGSGFNQSSKVIYVGAATVGVGPSTPTPKFYVDDITIDGSTYYLLHPATSANWDDVYRIDSSTVVRLDVNAGATTPVYSVAYNGTVDEGKLLAGLVATPTTYAAGGVNVKRTSDAQVRFPTWKSAKKAPSGAFATSNSYGADVAWAPDGSKAFCGTGSNALTAWDETAFSVSVDDAVSWNQLSLIDTQNFDTVSTAAVVSPAADAKGAGEAANYSIQDVAPSADSNTLYVLTTSADVAAANGVTYLDSVWRTTTDPIGNRWQRVYCFDATLAGDADLAKTEAGADNGIIRVSPEDETGGYVYMAVTGSQSIFYSANAGQIWSPRGCDVTITDLAVKNNSTLFALDGVNTLVDKSTDGSWTWPNAPVYNWGANNMITCVPDSDYVLCGGVNDGYVAYSSNDGASFAPISVALAGDTQVVADKNFADNNTVYAGSSDGKIYRWVIGSSTTWSTIDSVASSVTGIRQHCGTLYASSHDVDAIDPDLGSFARRSLNPTAGIPPGPDFDTMDIGLGAGVAFDAAPQALKVCGSEEGPVVLYAIDTADKTIRSYIDTMAKAGPTISGPEDNASIGVDPATGRASQIVLSWDPISISTSYQILMLVDGAPVMVGTFTPASNICSLALEPGGSAAIGTPALIPAYPAFIAGKTYKWKIRARDEVTGDKVRSQWSGYRSFTVEAGVPISAPYPGPQVLAPANGVSGASLTPAFSWSPAAGTEAREYKFVLSASSDLSSPLVDEAVTTTAYQCATDLDYSTTYFWQVTPTDPIGDASMVANFTTMAEPVVEAPLPSPPTPFWVWLVISLGAVLVIVTLILIFKTRRV